MSDRPERRKHPRSSRQRYREFVEGYNRRRLDDQEDAGQLKTPPDDPPTAEGGAAAEANGRRGGQRREYLSAYLRCLRPHRHAVAAIVLFALVVAGLEMIEPLFMRFIVDRVLLDAGLDPASRLTRLHLAGGTFLVVVVLSKLAGALKDSRQPLLNVRVMLTLRRSLYDRMLHLPLPRLWGMKTGGILSRLSGDIDTTTGLLQMAVVSPALSAVR